MISNGDIQEKFNEILDIISEEFDRKWIKDISLEITDEGDTYVMRNGLVVYLSLPKLKIAMDDGGFHEYRMVLDRIRVAYHVLPGQGRYIVTNDVLSWTLIHEIAHILTFHSYDDTTPHGKEFCKMYDTLIAIINPHVQWVFK